MDLINSYYLWLIPQKAARDEFQKIIQNLSEAYGTPAFEPHVTLVSGLSGNEEHLVKKIDAFARGKYSLSVAMKGIDYTHGFFTALFLNIPNTPAIDQLHTQAREHLKPFGQGPYHPHLSLLYGNITVQEKERIIANLNLSPQTITLDKLKLVKGHSDVTQWRVIREWPLQC